MSYRFLVPCLFAAAFLSGCALLPSTDAVDGPGEEIVSDEEFTATNGSVAVSSPVLLPADVRSPVTSLSVIDRPSPNFDTRTLPVTLIVLHYTAAPLKESLNALRDGRVGARVSSHYLVAEDGTIYRLVDESNRAWHAGVSRWEDITDVNSASIGIEMVNLGHDDAGRPRPYAAEQVEAVTRLCLDIQERYAIAAVVGHSDVAPARKIDPGGLFPWRILYERGVKVATVGFVPQ